MTAHDLLAAFDVLADAPDGSARLRELVLALAVRGKLVPQDPEDEPASVLLEAREVAPSEDPGIEAPQGWCWSCLSMLGEIRGGGTPDKRNARYWDGGIPWVSPKDMKRDDIGEAIDSVSPLAVEETSIKWIPAGALLMVVRGMILAHSFPTALTTAAVTVNQDMKALIPFDPRIAPYLLLATKGLKPRVLERVERSTHGTCKLSTASLLKMPIPMPPLAEQHRIVAQVDTLMALLDRLHAAQTARDTTRTALRDAALAALRDADDAEAVDAAWNRIAEQTADLFTDPADVAPLRQTILQLAVRGRLVPQDPTDEPASVLLEARETAPTEDITFDLAPGWCWSCLSKLGEIRGGGTPDKRDARYWGGSIPWVSPKDMKRDDIGEAIDTVTPLAVEETSIKRIPAGALLMVVRGMILAHSFPTALTTVGVTINQDMKALIPFDPQIARYLLLVTKALKPRVLERVERSTHGTCKLPTARLLKMPIPLPPLAEQHRIVARVDALMTLCDALEARLTAAREARAAFAAAAVHHLDL